MPPKVEVIVAARNAEATLASSLRSVQRQMLGEWRCWVVDDHSTDQTFPIAKRFAQQDSRFCVLSNPATVDPNAQESLHRLVEARNAAIAACSTPWLAIHDADDVMHQDRLRAQLDLAEEQNLDVVACAVRYFPRRALGEGMQRYEGWLNQQTPERLSLERFVEMPAAHPALIMKRDLVQQVGAYQDNGWPEDYDLYLRLIAGGAKVGTVSRRLLAWRIREQSTSRNHPSYTLAAFAKCRAHYLANDYLGQQPQYVLWGYGGTGRELARNLKQVGKEPSAILELHPGRIGQRILGVPVFSPQQYFVSPQFIANPSTPIVASVSGQRARTLIRAFFKDLSTQLNRSFKEGVDFIFAA